MPKIRIKERDLTTNPLVGNTTNYILYVVPTGKDISSTGIDLTYPREITAEEAKKLEDVIATVLEEEEDEGTSQKDFFLTEAIELGGKIVVAKDWDTAKEYCGDRNQYDIKFVLAKESEIDNALAIAQTRKDCAVILSVEAAEAKLDSHTISVCKAECNYIKGTDGDFYVDEEKQFAGKYVIAFYAKGGIHKIVEGEKDYNTVITPGEAYLLAYLDSIRKGRAEWLAVAGATGGAIPGNYEVDGFLKESEIDSMQLRTYNVDAPIAINPICNMNPWGMRIWGNRTCLPNMNVGVGEGVALVPDANSDQLVASSFANVRVLICDIKKAMYKASRQYQFEQNSDVLWVNFQSSINTLLEEMKQSYGIAAYRWEREETTERAKLKAKLKIVPIEPVEDFDLSIELSDSLEVAE